MILLVLIAIPLAAAVLSFSFRQARLGSAITLIGALATLVLSVRAALDVIASPEHVLVAIANWIRSEEHTSELQSH